jgi:myo-inositol-1(or 4)-monophosphatase
VTGAPHGRPAAGPPWGDDLLLAVAAACEAGRGIMEAFGQEHDVVQKGPDQPLTAADLAADRALRERLCGGRPDYGWLSEETADGPDRLGRRLVWIVDPIDGTRSFIQARREFAVSVGLSRGGAAVLGVVHNPATGEVYWAVRGGGAFLADAAGKAAGDAAAVLQAGRPLRVRGPDAAGPASYVASRSELAAGELAPFLTDARMVPTGSTAYKLARVAAGAADAYVSRGPKSEWDVCAGVLLVEEAGGAATDTDGAPVVYNRRHPFVRGVIAANPALHGQLVARVRRLGPLPRTEEEEARSGPEPRTGERNG